MLGAAEGEPRFVREPAEGGEAGLIPAQRRLNEAVQRDSGPAQDRLAVAAAMTLGSFVERDEPLDEILRRVYAQMPKELRRDRGSGCARFIAERM